ncbi:MAG: amino acid racemase [Bacteroidales bacterium]|nr:amino acid racemase [Bacteroidales bacterium]MBR7035216.1 amino acid racemase [Bacteroidales bacterium]
MKKIGLIGGVGPVSTVNYYLELNRLYHNDFGVNEYPEFVIDSLSLNKVTTALADERYDIVCEILKKSADILRNAGAECVAICSNTPHIVLSQIVDELPLPFVSIVDATVRAVKNGGYKNVLVLGTLATMQSVMYQSVLAENGISSVTPSVEDQQTIADIIFPNLENGIVDPDERLEILALVEKYIAYQSVDAVLLACTELPLIIKPADLTIPVIDTALVHAKEIYEFAVKQ